MADADIGSLVVRIETDLKNFETGMNNMSDKVDGFGSTVKKLGGVIAGVFAVSAIGGFFKSTIEDAAEAEDNLSALNAVIASTGGKAGISAEQVTEMAAALQKTTKFSDDAIVSASNLLLTFTSIGKDVFPQAQETVLNMSQALGQDLKSSSIQLGKALNDPINGMSALSRVGVSFTQAQKDQITTMQESGNIMGAQKVILAELGTEFGNAAVAAGETFSGKIERVKNQFGELKESIGGALLPVLSNLTGWFLDKMPAIQETAGIVFDKIASVVGIAVDIFKANFMPIIQEIFNFIQANWPVIQSTFETVFNAIVSVAKTMWDFWKTNILPIFQEFVNFISAHMPQIQSTFQSVFDAIIKVTTQAWAFFKENLLPILASIYQEVLSHMPQIEKIISGVFTVIKNVVEIAWRIFENLLLPILKALWDFISPTFPLIGTIVKKAFDIVIAIVQTVIDIFVKVTDTIKTAIDWLTNWNGTKPKAKTLEVTPYVSPTVNTGNAGNNPLIPKFASGTNFVPFDMLAQIHKGEAVVPAKNNPSNPNANNPMGGGISFEGAIFNVRSDTDIKMIAREIFNLSQAKSRGSGVVYG